MEKKELIQKTKEELQEMLAEYREKIRQLRFDIAAGKMKKVSDVQRTRRAIARILTILAQQK